MIISMTLGVVLIVKWPMHIMTPRQLFHVPTRSVSLPSEPIILSLQIRLFLRQNLDLAIFLAELLFHFLLLLLSVFPL